MHVRCTLLVCWGGWHCWCFLLPPSHLSPRNETASKWVHEWDISPFSSHEREREGGGENPAHFASKHEERREREYFPTNNALLINFRLSSDAEILLISTDWAYKIGAKRATCTFSNWASILHTTVSGWALSCSLQQPQGCIIDKSGEEKHVNCLIAKSLMFLSIQFAYGRSKMGGFGVFFWGGGGGN